MCLGCCFLQLLRALVELDPAMKGGWKNFLSEWLGRKRQVFLPRNWNFHFKASKM